MSSKVNQILLVSRVEHGKAVFYAEGIFPDGSDNYGRQRHDCSHQDFIPKRGQIIESTTNHGVEPKPGSDWDYDFKAGSYKAYTGIPDELLLRYLEKSHFFYGIGSIKVNQLFKELNDDLSALRALLHSDSPPEYPATSCLTERTRKCLVLGSKLMRWQQECLIKGISYQTTRNFFDVYRWRTVEVFEENPFKILPYADTMDYRKLWDTIKSKYGPSESNAAALWATFYDANTRYKTSISLEDLEQKLKDDFKIKASTAGPIIKAACDRKFLMAHKNSYQLSSIAVFEKATANYLKAFNAADQPTLFKKQDFKRLIENFGERSDLPKEETIKKIKEFSEGQMLLIYGDAGTGKTYISARILDQCARAGSAIRPEGESPRLAIKVVAVSNIAVSRVRLELEKLLDDNSRENVDVSYESVAKFLLTDVSEKAPPFVLLLDEASMLGAGQALEIFGKLRDQDRLIMVGDPRQIPPIGWGALFHALKDDFKGINFNRIHLTENKRQGAKEHPILQMIGALKKDHDLKKAVKGKENAITIPADKDDPLTQLNNYLKSFKKNLLKNLPPILCFSREDVAQVNSHIQEYLKNSKTSETNKKVLQVGPSELREGEPVINVFNRKDLDLWNGTRGRVIRKGNALLAEFTKDDGTTKTCQTCLLDSGIQRAYAVTVHRAQGEGHKKVIIFLGDNVSERLVHQGSLYTAITRASEELIFIGSVEKFDEGYARPNLARKSNFLEFAFGSS